MARELGLEQFEPVSGEEVIAAVDGAQGHRHRPARMAALSRIASVPAAIELDPAHVAMRTIGGRHHAVRDASRARPTNFPRAKPRPERQLLKDWLDRLAASGVVRVSADDSSLEGG
jgi:hypothetical protein